MIEPGFALSLVENFGTPLYAYDLCEIESRAKELRSNLPQATLLYSVKANPLPAIGAVLRNAGCEAEVSSAGELQVALDAEFDPANILFGGPGKTYSELQFALGQGVRKFSIESWTDMARLEAAVEGRDETVSALLRINPTKGPRSRLAMTGPRGHFGFSEEALLT